jgi:hypothetical protein
MLRLQDCGTYGKSGILDVLARIGFFGPQISTKCTYHTLNRLEAFLGLFRLECEDAITMCHTSRT